MSETKPYEISKQAVWKAYQTVKANQGAAGVDGKSIEEFERNLKGNLYKVWNRMSSGSYFPPAVLMVEIAKPDGQGVRILGVPTVADRVAQTLAKHVPGTGGGTDVSPGLVRLPTRAIGTGCSWGLSGAVLEV